MPAIEKRADRPNRITLGADKGGACPRAGQRPDPGDAQDFLNELRSMNLMPHIARTTAGRRSAIDERTTRHPGYRLSQRIRRRGRERVDMAFAFSAAACNLIRLPKLLAAPVAG